MLAKASAAAGLEVKASAAAGLEVKASAAAGLEVKASPAAGLEGSDAREQLGSAHAEGTIPPPVKVLNKQ